MSKVFSRPGSSWFQIRPWRNSLSLFHSIYLSTSSGRFLTWRSTRAATFLGLQHSGPRPADTTTNILPSLRDCSTTQRLCLDQPNNGSWPCHEEHPFPSKLAIRKLSACRHG